VTNDFVEGTVSFYFLYTGTCNIEIKKHSVFYILVLEMSKSKEKSIFIYLSLKSLNQRIN